MKSSKTSVCIRSHRHSPGFTMCALVKLLVLTLCASHSDGERNTPSLYPLGHSSVEEIEPDALRQIISHATDARYTTVVEFFAPWCPHCQAFAPKYEEVGEHFAGDSRVRICAVDCVRFDEACKGQDIKGFPALRVFHALGEADSLAGNGFTLRVFEPNKITQWIEDHLTPSQIVLPAAERLLAPAAPAAPLAAASTAAALHPLSAGDAHEPLSPSVMLKHSGERWSSWSSAGHRSERLGDMAASLLFGLHYGV